MSYGSIKNKTNQMPYSLNDPYNVCSYAPLKENFLPFNYVQTQQEKAAIIQAQQAIQQQIIQLHREQELQRLAKESATLKKLQILQKLARIDRKEVQDRERTVQDLESEIKTLHSLIEETQKI